MVMAIGVCALLVEPSNYWWGCRDRFTETGSAAATIAEISDEDPKSTGEKSLLKAIIYMREKFMSIE